MQNGDTDILVDIVDITSNLDESSRAEVMLTKITCKKYYFGFTMWIFATRDTIIAYLMGIMGS